MISMDIAMMTIGLIILGVIVCVLVKYSGDHTDNFHQ